ncbi:MAG: hypothetical protein IJC32_01480 [Clostridia bacterium]|nr:hypothetical protein [Clostridia bacterium]
MGRRIRYRRYVGRRKSERGRSRIIILCVLIFTALVVYLSVMLGLDLREKAERSAPKANFSQQSKPPQQDRFSRLSEFRSRKRE